MPDAARNWLEKAKNAAWPDEVDIVAAQSHLRRLLEQNERLEARLGAFELRVIDLGLRVATKHAQNAQLEADRKALVAYVRAFRKSMVDKFPLLCSYGKSYSNDDETIEAWQASSPELRSEIE